MMPTIFNKKTAAKTLGLSEETINRAMKAGLLPYRKCGQRVVFTESDLTTYLAACAVPAKGSKEIA